MRLKSLCKRRRYPKVPFGLMRSPDHVSVGGRRQPRVAKPVLMLLKGHPGCGKSTLGRNVARSLGWSLVDKDDAKGALQRCAIECAGVDAVSYDIMFSAARTLLRVGLSVIVDCPLSRRALYDKASALAEQIGGGGV
ncbi:unnamed protein product [Ostreobium quekettii]|uniref:AAA family ATPase n=1 Tax=Ostreobium quekettii TaxID=121088 RepID=A0A8S1IUL9_9CHLO|nr:unnamed protein product [Ostreobium quekettii]